MRSTIRHHVWTLCLIITLLLPLGARAYALGSYTVMQNENWVNLSEEIGADALGDRLILLDFWTFCCINCIQAMPMVNQIHHDFADKLTVIGVHSGKFGNEKTPEPIRRAIARYGIDHAVYNDASFDVWKHYEVKGWPTLILLAPDGEIIWRYFGEAPYDAVAKAVTSAIDKYDGQIKAQPLPVKETVKSAAKESAYYYPSKIIALDKGGFALSDSGHDAIVILNSLGQEVKRYSGFSAPQGLAYDGAQNFLYVADTGNHQLKRINLKNDKIKVLIGRAAKRGPIVKGRAAKGVKSHLASPWDITFFDGQLIIANAGTHQLLSYDIARDKLSVFAGNGGESIDDGSYPQNSLSQPSALAVMGKYLYFLDAETSALRRVDRDGNIKTLIGTGLFDFGHRDGGKDTARMQHPLGLAADATHNRLFIADSYNHALRLYDVHTGLLQTISGKAGQFGTGQMDTGNIRYHEPNDVMVLPDGQLMIVDTNNHRIVKLDPRGGKVAPF
jgi:thiol-disulfide isomerase/thioredoxin